MENIINIIPAKHHLGLGLFSPKIKGITCIYMYMDILKSCDISPCLCPSVTCKWRIPLWKRSVLFAMKKFFLKIQATMEILENSLCTFACKIHWVFIWLWWSWLHTGKCKQILFCKQKGVHNVWIFLNVEGELSIYKNTWPCVHKAAVSAGFN